MQKCHSKNYRFALDLVNHVDSCVAERQKVKATCTSHMRVIEKGRCVLKLYLF